MTTGHTPVCDVTAGVCPGFAAENNTALLLLLFLISSYKAVQRQLFAL